MSDLAYDAWVVIANVSEGDWTKQEQEWQDAARRWREQFHASLDQPSAEDGGEPLKEKDSSA